MDSEILAVIISGRPDGPSYASQVDGGTGFFVCTIYPLHSWMESTKFINLLQLLI